MRPTAACLFAVILVTVAPGCRATPGRAHVPPGGINVPMPIVDGFPIVQVLINGRGPFAFMVDTGTTEVVVSPRLCNDLALRRRGKAASLRASDGRDVRAPRTRIDHLSIGGAAFEDVPAVVLRTPLPPGVAGLLGMRLFRSGVLTLHFPQQRLSLRPGRLDASDPHTQSVPFRGSVPTVPVSPATRLPGWIVYADLDTGLNGGIRLPAKLRGRMSIDRNYESQVTTETAAGQQTLDMVRLLGPVRLGRHSIDSPYVILEPGRGRIGTLTLRRFDVSTDPASHQVRLWLAPSNSP